MNSDQRDHQRESQNVNDEFSFFHVDEQRYFFPQSELRGTIIDMSASGIGLLTDCTLKPGNLLKFNHSDLPQLGVVMWTVNTGDKFRVGIRFL